jgi:hypothetical protein
VATIELARPAKPSPAAAQLGRRLQVAGGIAAMLEGLALLATLVLFVIVQPAMGLKDSYWDEPAKIVPFIAAHQGYFVSAGLFMVLSALIVLPVVVALYDRLRSLSAATVVTATLFGVVGMAMLLLDAAVQTSLAIDAGTLSVGSTGPPLCAY